MLDGEPLVWIRCAECNSVVGLIEDESWDAQPMLRRPDWPGKLRIQVCAPRNSRMRVRMAYVPFDECNTDLLGLQWFQCPCGERRLFVAPDDAIEQLSVAR